jgi:hypothetical protein
VWKGEKNIMSNEAPPITLLQRREIEARIVAPLVRAVIDELGETKTLDLLRNVITNLAREAGADLARELGEASLPAFAQALDRWKAGGALEITMIESSSEKLDFDVTRCRYAEMYRALGLQELGGSLSCCRDFALIEGFNSKVSLTRTQTIMEGATHCDFRFRAPEEKP